MKKYLIDTNIAIRILTNDPPELVAQLEGLLEKVDNREISFFVPSIVIAEVCWILQSVYSFSKKEIGQALLEFVSSEGVEVEEKFVLQALESFYKNNVDFIDAYLSLKANQNETSIITWNKKDFKKLECEFYSPSEITK
ncbi:PIN domain-containing protein [Bacillaceae bacterium S4-13-58]